LSVQAALSVWTQCAPSVWTVPSNAVYLPYTSICICCNNSQHCKKQ